MVRGRLAPGGFWERVQGVGLIVWVNTRPMVCDSPSARSAVAREARFIGELSKIIHRSVPKILGTLIFCVVLLRET